MADDTATGPHESGEGFVRSLERGLAVIKAFGADSPEMTLSEVARKTGLARASAGRFLRTLVALDYASFNGRVYRLRPRVLELGTAYFSTHSFIEIANPILHAAAEKCQEPFSMAVLDGAEIVYVARHTADRMMSISINVGKRYSAFSTSLGRTLLGGLPDAELDQLIDGAELRAVTPHTITDKAELKQVILDGRANGFCQAESQLEVGILSIAVPVRDQAGKMIAAINTGVPASRHNPDSLRNDFLPTLLESAREIEFALSQRL